MSEAILVVFSPLLDKAVQVHVILGQPISELFKDIREKLGDDRIKDLRFRRGSTLSERVTRYGEVVTTLFSESDGERHVSVMTEELLGDLLRSGHIFAYDASLRPAVGGRKIPRKDLRRRSRSVRKQKSQENRRKSRGSRRRRRN
jgi:hypothetical protein